MASKRRKANNAPNIPKETLERVRSQINAPKTTDSDVPEAAEKPAVMLTMDTPVVSSSALRARRQGAVKRRGGELERRSKDGLLDTETIEDWLMNPTKFPTAEDLKKDYRTVINDLRNMFLLAGALMALLVVITPLMN